jgi:hypothetical protein
MPWCEDCAKYWAPSAMREDGSCPRCGRNLDAPPKVTAENLDLRKLAAGEDADDEDYKAPWHFKLLVVLLVIYLAWRFIQLFG